MRLNIEKSTLTGLQKVSMQNDIFLTTFFLNIHVNQPIAIQSVLKKDLLDTFIQI